MRVLTRRGVEDCPFIDFTGRGGGHEEASTSRRLPLDPPDLLLLHLRCPFLYLPRPPQRGLAYRIHIRKKGNFHMFLEHFRERIRIRERNCEGRERRTEKKLNESKIPNGPWNSFFDRSAVIFVKHRNIAVTWSERRAIHAASRIIFSYLVYFFLSFVM